MPRLGDGVLGAVAGDDVVAGFRQQVLQHVTLGGRVVDDEDLPDAAHHGSLALGVAGFRDDLARGHRGRHAVTPQRP